MLINEANFIVRLIYSFLNKSVLLFRVPTCLFRIYLFSMKSAKKTPTDKGSTLTSLIIGGWKR